MSGGAAAAATGSFHEPAPPRPRAAWRTAAPAASSQASGNSGDASKPPDPKKVRKGDKDGDAAMEGAKEELQKILEDKGGGKGRH